MHIYITISQTYDVVLVFFNISNIHFSTESPALNMNRKEYYTCKDKRIEYSSCYCSLYCLERKKSYQTQVAMVEYDGRCSSKIRSLRGTYAWTACCP
jgi:Zn-finger protein